MQQTYGLKTLNCPPKIKEMVLFEWDLWDLVNKRKFQKVSNFQNQLKASKKLKKLFVFTDKTSDIYQTERWIQQINYRHNYVNVQKDSR